MATASSTDASHKVTHLVVLVHGYVECYEATLVPHAFQQGLTTSVFGDIQTT